MYKNKLFLTVIFFVAILSVAYFNGFFPSGPQSPPLLKSPDITNLPQTESPTPASTKGVNITKAPLPTGDNKTTFIGEKVPWELILGEASCQLKGEVKFLNHSTYDNQDALFTYSGIDHPGRNIIWTVTPQDDLLIGPNLFNKLYLPKGESLLGISLPENPKYKSYELTAKIQYGRLVDDSGNFVTAGGDVKVFEKQCIGKTTVVLP